MKDASENLRCFAYGSNMRSSQMIERCPQSKFYSKACLENWELVFNKFSINRKCHAANIRPSPGKVVWGVLFELSESDWASLDKSEGSSYKKTPIKVLIDGSSVNCIAYVADANKSVGKPSKDYIALIVEGGREFDLPADYIASVEGAVCL